MSETIPEPNEKPSATLSRFDQNLAFFVMVLACAAVTFIKLDDLIGAAGLKMIAAWYGFIGTCLIAIVAIFLIFRWKMINFVLVLAVCVIFILSILLTFYIALLVFVLPAALVASLPAIIFPILLGIVLILWWVIRRSRQPVSPFVLKLFTFFVLILCSGYLIANIANEGFIDRIAQANTGKHHYFLDERIEIFENVFITSYTLVLHECNRYALNCRQIYESEQYSQGGGFVTIGPAIELRVQDKLITIYVDDELWFEHQSREG